MKPNEKIDLFKLFRDEYKASKQPVLIETRNANYLQINGSGVPGSDDYAAKVGALYAMAFSLKMTRKKEGKGDYVISKLEALCWSENGEMELDKVNREAWQWKLMIRTPDFVKPDELEKVSDLLDQKCKGAYVRDVTIAPLHEGMCVQMLHVGPYENEAETLSVMSDFIKSKGLTHYGRHHEIYLSDPRRVPSEKLKTILRHPVTS